MGYIYVLYNKLFQFYGDNVYKIGRTNNLNNRMSSYTTSYPDKSKYMFTIEVPEQSILCEAIIFKTISQYRMRKNREFFQCPLDEIIQCITLAK